MKKLWKKRYRFLIIILLSVSFLSVLPIPKVYGQFTYGYWSWDSTNNILTIIANATNNEGNTEINAYGFQDIIDSGLVPSIYYNVSATGLQFEFSFRIIIGNGSAITWFIDSDKQITFTSISFSANNQILIDVTTNATFRSGILEDSATKRTYGGCQFITNASSYVGSAFVRGYNGLVELYSTVIDNLEQKVYTLIYDEGKIYNCIFRGASIWGTSTSNIDAEKVILQKGISALDHPMGSLNDISVYDHDYAVIYYLSDVFDLENFEAKGNTKAFKCYQIKSDAHIINSNIDNWNFEWVSGIGKKIYRQYSFDLGIFFKNGTSIQNANVTISNEYLDSSDSWLTFANGSIPQQIFSYGHYDQSGADYLYDYNPYNLTVTLAGYETYTDMINITKKENLRVCLCPVKPSYGLGLGSGFILAFILSMALLAVGALVIKRRS